jgi:predicted RNase H-like HicB family nuclease
LFYPDIAFITIPSQVMHFTIEIEQEEDGRFLAEVIGFPGVLTYGQTRQEAVARVQALALRVLIETNRSRRRERKGRRRECVSSKVRVLTPEDL